MKKKIKKYAGGGLSGIASEATSLMGAVDSAANAINSIKSGSGGGQGPIGGGGSLGFMASTPKADKLEPMVMKPNYMGGPMPNPPPLSSNPTQGLRSGNPDMYNQLLTQQKGFASQLSGLANSGKLMSFKKGGKVSSASKRADGVATKGKTKGRIV